MSSSKSAPAAGSVVAGIFVGGAGKRMGGRPKGLLAAPGGGTLVGRWRTVLHEVGVERVMLVGRHEAYESVELETIPDDPPGIGPLGGLAGLLERAGSAQALALACDMPFVSGALLARLLASPDAAAVAPRREGRWEPLCARYDPARVLPIVRRRVAAGQHSLQPLLDEAGAVELRPEADDAGQLVDWDTPADAARG